MARSNRGGLPGALLWVVALGLVGSCGGVEQTSAGRAELVDGAIVLHSELEFASGGIKYVGPTGLAIDGDRVAVNVASSSSTFTEHPPIAVDPSGDYTGDVPGGGSGVGGGVHGSLFISEDLGRSWRGLSPQGGPYYSTVLHEGRILLPRVFGRDGALRMNVYELDPTTDAVTQLGDTFESKHAQYDGARLMSHQFVLGEGTSDPEAFPDAFAGEYAWQALDLDSGEMQRVSAQPITYGECRRPALRVLKLTESKKTYHGVSEPCRRGGKLQSCRLVWQPPPHGAETETLDPRPTSICELALDLPIEHTVDLDGQVAGVQHLALGETTFDEYWQARDGSHGKGVVLWRDLSGSPEPVYLGEGEWVEQGQPFGFHEHLGVQAIIRRPDADEPGGLLEYLHLGASGPPQRLRFLPSPCRSEVQSNGEHCHGQLALAARLDEPGTGYEQHWFTVYRVQTLDPLDASGRRTAHIVTLVQTLTPEPLDVELPPGFPGAAAACWPPPAPPADFEEACLRYASTCSPVEPFSVSLCIDRMLRSTPAERQAFVDAVPTCPPWPQVLDCNVAPQCVEGGAIQECDPSEPRSTVDCAAIAGACVVADDGRVVCGEASCRLFDDELDTFEQLERGVCQGDRLVTRVRGVVRVLSCSELGLGPCWDKELTTYRACGPAPPAPEQLEGGVAAGALERACARIVACGESWTGQDVFPLHALFEACVAQGMWGSGAADDLHDSVYQRIMTATTCDDLERALPSLFEIDHSCSADECVDDVAYACQNDGRLHTGLDCSAEGAVCAVGAEGARCVAPTSFCEAAPTQYLCTPDGGLCLPAEYHPELSWVDCAAKGLTCARAEGDSRPRCALPAGECETQAAGATCVGDVEVACFLGLALPGQHCARLPGFACVDGQCQAHSADCGESSLATCDGDVLRYCYAHSVRALDCAALGTSCVDDADGARCAVSAE